MNTRKSPESLQRTANSPQTPQSNAKSLNISLVTGPARSGKSEWAELLAMNAEQQGQLVVYVATSVINKTDAEWQSRIELHRQRRPDSWSCLEGPVDLVEVIATADRNTCLLIDSLGTWLANELELDDEAWAGLLERLLGAIQTNASPQATLIFVAEETGWGVVPAYPIGRTFRDRLGQLIRRLGAIANPVYLVTGGHVLNLSALGTPLHRRSSS